LYHRVRIGINGESFDDGFNKTVSDVIDGATEFGDKHADKLTEAAVNIGKSIADDVINF
jgi:hypothetical protein